MPDQDREDSESLPETQPHPPPGFDTDPLAAGAQPEAEASEPEESREQAEPPEQAEAPEQAEVAEQAEGAREQAEAAEHAEVAEPPTVEAPPSEPLHAPARPVTVPGQYHYLKWWQFVLVLLGVWIPAAVIGPGLFGWWTEDHSPHKTPVVFVVLLYVIVCTVAGLMLAMVTNKPVVSALAVAVMSAPFASVAAAAPFYGAFYCDHWSGSCLFGIIPY